MAKNNDQLKPVGTFRPLDSSPDPLVAQFECVVEHRRRFGIFGAVREVFAESTYPDVIRMIDGLEKTGRTKDVPALRGMAEEMERELDFSDDLGDHTELVMSGMR